jgi:thymidine kinase
MELADHIEKIPTMCHCGSQAEFNCRKVGNLYVFEGSQVAIDGDSAVTYDSLCGKCYSLEGGRI